MSVSLSRFEHMHICAGSGQGKTQLLQYLISEDLKTDASVVVMDSQGDLINNLKYVVPPERLVCIDASDVEYPVCLNLFDVNMKRVQSYPMADRARILNGIIEMYDFVFGSLLEAGMTQKQNTLFRYIIRLVLHIPDATIHTLGQLLKEGGLEQYHQYVDELTGTAREFFEEEFNDKEYRDTKAQVRRRFYGILENDAFRNMFSHPRSKIDLFTELNAGKVILINTAKDILKDEGSQIFGRFFIALIRQAGQERATIPLHQRRDTLFYIDEAQDYFDHNITTILTQMRKYRIGLTIAHQFLGQLGKIQSAVHSVTTTKMCGGLDDDDNRVMARQMRCDAAFIAKQPTMHFATFIRKKTPTAVSVKVPFMVVEKMRRLDETAWERVLDQQRTKYAVHYSELEKELSAEALVPELEPVIIPKAGPPKRAPVPDKSSPTKPKQWL